MDGTMDTTPLKEGNHFVCYKFISCRLYVRDPDSHNTLFVPYIYIYIYIYI